jgi:hypothetical protein
VILVLIFFVLAFIFILLLWGGGMLLQGYLYQGPADRLPIRAAASGATMALFLTLWTALDRANPGKYETLFDFSPQEVTEIDAFESVMKSKSGDETRVLYRRKVGSGGATKDFFNDGEIKDEKGKPWIKNTSERMTVAILVREKDKNEPTRFNANLEKNEKGEDIFPRDLTQLRYTDGSGRWLTADSLGHVYRRKTGVLLANLSLNLAHLMLWAAVLWFGMRFNLWHAIGLALVVWIFLMIAIQPLLFKLARP